MTEGKKRFWTGAGIAIATYAVLLLPSKVWPVSLAATLLSAVAVYEIYRAAGMDQDRRLLSFSILAAGLFVCLPTAADQVILPAAYIASVLFYGCLIVRAGDILLRQRWQHVLITFGVVLMFKAIPVLRQQKHGLFCLIVAVTSCFLTDAAAYHVGKRWGKHKLISKVSPNKTLEGACGGTAIAVALLAVLKRLIGWLTGSNAAWSSYLLLVFLLSLTAQVGDLAMSALKRHYDVKDFGTILPGHGGILDRFDSQLFVIAAVNSFVLMFPTFSANCFR